jgi:hypothetical protein
MVFEPVISERAHPMTVSTPLGRAQMLFSRLNKQNLHILNGSLLVPI